MSTKNQRQSNSFEEDTPGGEVKRDVLSRLSDVKSLLDSTQASDIYTPDAIPNNPEPVEAAPKVVKMAPKFVSVEEQSAPIEEQPAPVDMTDLTSEAAAQEIRNQIQEHYAEEPLDAAA